MLKPCSDQPVVNDTPIEHYLVNGCKVHVKREDLSSPHPGPQFSKIRGLYAHMLKLKAAGWCSVGILDTIHSKAGWAVAYTANMLGMQAYVFFPVYKANIGVDAMQEQHRMAAYLGAILIPMEAGAGYILAIRAKKLLEELTQGQGYMLPVGLKLREAVKANAKEALNVACNSDLLRRGSCIVSASSGTIASGLWYAMLKMNSQAKLYCHLGYDRPAESFLAYMGAMAGAIDSRIVIVNEHYAYKDKVDYPAPFPCNPYYDLKAWKWLNTMPDFHSLERPILFWNIGA